MEAKAWLLELGPAQYAAVGERELVHVLPDEPRIFPVPGSPTHVRGAIAWQGTVLPALDLDIWLNRPVQAAHAALDPNVKQVMVIVAFRSAGESIALGSMLLRQVPQRLVVNDGQDCPLPARPSAWRDVAHACFEHEKFGPVPILDLRAIFSGQPPDRTCASAD